MAKVVILSTLLSSLNVAVHTREIKIGLLMPRNGTVGYLTSAGAASLAIEKAQADGLVADHTFKFVYKDDQSSPSQGAGETSELRDEGVDVIIGSPLSEVAAASALSSAYWNIPHITWAAPDPELGNKTLYKTLVRMSGDYGKLGGSYHGIVHEFKWRRMGVLGRGPKAGFPPTCSFAIESIQKEFVLMSTRHKYTLSEFIQYNPDTLTDDAIDRYLSRLQQRARVIAICGYGDEERNILLRAKALGLTSGDYVFLIPRTYSEDKDVKPWYRGDAHDNDARQAYKSVILVTFLDLMGQEVEQFKKTVSIRMESSPWNTSYATEKNLPASRYSPFLHDAVYLYMLALNMSRERNVSDINDGLAMFNLMKSLSFEGMSGPVRFNKHGDRNPDFWMWTLRLNGNFEPVATVNTLKSAKEEVTMMQEPFWFLNDDKMPPDTPACGFENELCDGDGLSTLVITCIILASMLTMCVVVTAFFYYHKQRRFEANVLAMTWMIEYSNLVPAKGLKDGLGSERESGHIGSLRSISTSATQAHEHNFCDLYIYNGAKVAVRVLDVNRLDLKRHHHVELQLMHEMSHPNINAFVGACRPTFCLVYAYCEKGSLEDVLENSEISLDAIFRYSFISDLASAMKYLHHSKIKSHGRLKSTNCVVDNRWVLKVTDYGIADIRKGKANERNKFYGLLWTAPELLRFPVDKGSQEGDVYSFGIILHEIVFREGVFGDCATPEEVVAKIINEKLRPKIPVASKIGTTDGRDISLTQAVNIMQVCWLEEPSLRPTFVAILNTVKKMNRSGKNVVDKMIQMMEKYANNLEKIVEQRTNDLMVAKMKTDALLYEMLPRSIADCLKSGEAAPPKYHQAVTVLFSDIVGFTRISSESTPMQIVDFLNDLYTMFDDVICAYKVYKVETIGDSYMVASGVPEPIVDHIEQIADMSLHMLLAVSQFKMQHRSDTKLIVRIGVHTGPCCAGVVGLKMPRFCLFGDTVNTASRMESHGQGMRIQLSEQTNQGLMDVGGYVTEYRGEVDIKGKGMMKTYWLTGRSARRLSSSVCNRPNFTGNFTG